MPPYSKKTTELEKDVNKIRRGDVIDTFYDKGAPLKDKMVGKGYTEVIDTKSPMPLKSGKDFTDTIAEKLKSRKVSGLKSLASKGLKSLGLGLGTLSAIRNKDIEAAIIPEALKSEGLDPAKGQEGYNIEDPSVPMSERNKEVAAASESLSEEMKNKLKKKFTDQLLAKKRAM